MNEQELFQSHLRTLGYEIAIDNPILIYLFKLYQSGELYWMFETEFLPVYLWQEEAKRALAPYMKVLV